MQTLQITIIAILSITLLSSSVVYAEDMMEDGPIQNSTSPVYEDMTDDNETMEEWPIVIQLRAMIAELEATITGLETKITELREDKQNKNAKIAELRDKLKAKNNQTENQDVKLQTKLENKNAKIDRLEDKIVKLEKIIDRKDSKIDRKDTNVDNKKEKIGMTQDDLNAQASEIESLKATLQNQTSIIESMKTQMGEADNKKVFDTRSLAINWQTQQTIDFNEDITKILVRDRYASDRLGDTHRPSIGLGNITQFKYLTPYCDNPYVLYIGTYDVFSGFNTNSAGNYTLLVNSTAHSISGPDERTCAFEWNYELSYGTYQWAILNNDERTVFDEDRSRLMDTEKKNGSPKVTGSNKFAKIPSQIIIP